MAITVNTNLSSLQAQLNLNNSSMSLNQSLQRLSSGFRINSGKDDAAGLAISQTLTSAIRGNNQAMRNANDGVSVGQTAEGAMGQIANNLQRIREIAVQASNGGVSDKNRSQLQNEVDQLTQEISRTIQTTEFNGTKLLSGGANLTFQVGSKGAADNQINIQTVDMTQTTDPKNTATAAQWTDLKGKYQAVATAQKDYDTETDPAAKATKQGTLNTAKTALTASTKTLTDAGVSTDHVAAFTSALDQLAAAGADGDKQAAANAAITKAQAGIPVLNSYNTNLLNAKTIDVTTQSGASSVLSALDADIAKISDVRSTFGSVMNRFDAVVANLGNYTQNLTAANSRIMDVDFASETANLTRGQILQQAGGSILKQANSLPQAALSLLQ
ncbi:flagellin FliC [Chromobacterium vaccinii]|uniref:flagellin N-terminal helical domain-containing protein n=1 Tax=Chromobacterium vaccinii TaxID=1108595 RepID=UPI001E49E6EA|nr:flagellin [Chromobacterium vaccinii]MCD4483135.1 flagellin FliC [Chromobacterium vaccinii]